MCSRVRGAIGTRTVGIHRLLVHEMLHEQPTGRVLDEVSLESRHALVLGRVGEVVPGVIRGSKGGVGRVEVENLRYSVARGVPVVVRVNVI